MAQSLELLTLDLDGPVIKSWMLYYRSVVAMFRTYELPPPSFQIFRDGIGTTTDTIIAFFRAHGIPRSVDADDMAYIRDRYIERHWKRAKCDKYAEFLLRTCFGKGIPVVAVSGNSQSVIERRLSEFRLDKLMTQAVSTNNKQATLMDLLNIFEVKAEKAFHVDDIAEGVIAAKNLGMRTIAFTGGYNTKKRLMAARPDFPNRKFPRVDNLKTVANILF